MSVYWSGLLIRGVASALTLYMMLILLRWLGSRLELDLHAGRLRWIPRLTDPLIDRIRRVLPPMGPADLAPLVAVLGVWLVRELAALVLLMNLR